MSEFDNRELENKISPQMQVVTGDSLGGTIAKQLIPGAIAAPLVACWSIRQGEIAGWYDSNFALWLMALSLIVITLVIIGCNAAIVNKIDGDRKRSSDRLRSSEERLQLALRGSGQGIWDWDLKTEVLTWDDRTKEIFGLPADVPVSYKWHLEALHPDDRQRVSNAAVIALRDRTEFNEEYRTFHPDGTMHWILARGRGYYNGKGEPERISGTVMDISDRKVAEASLVETNNILKAVINGTNDFIFVKDLQGRYVIVNQAAARWLGTTVESMLGKDDMALFPVDVAQRIQAVDRQVIARREFISYEEQLLKQNEMRSLLSTKYPWRNDRDEIIGLIGISIDVTDLKQTEVALRESEQRYRFLVENTSDLVFRVGLRQPLALNLPIEQAVDEIFREAFFVTVNDGFARAYGYERADELVGKPLSDLFPRTPENEAMERVLVTNGHRIIEARTEEVDRYGERKVILNSIVGRIEDGFVYDYVGTSRDITERVIAEEALIDREQRYRYIFESVGVSIWEEDFSEVKEAIDRLKASGVSDFHAYFTEHPEFVQWAIGAIRILDVNDFTLQMIGTRNKAQFLTSLEEIFLPETIEVFTEELLAIAAGETFFQAETLLRNVRGERLYVLFTITFPPPSEPYDRVLVTLLDITNRKQAQLNDRFLSELDLKLRQLINAEAMQWEVVSSLGEYLKVDRATWIEIDRDNRLLTIHRDWRSEGLPSHAGTHSLSDFISLELQAAHAAGDTIVFSDIASDPHSASYINTYQHSGIGAMVAVPCIHEGRWVAVLTVSSRNPRNWRDDEVNLLQEIVARLWSIIEQTRAIQALRESEERLRLALMASQQGLYDLNLQTGEAKVSPEYALMLDYDPETFVETKAKWLERLHPDDRKPVSKVYQEYIAGDRNEYRVEFRQRSHSGDWKWVLSLGKIVAWDAEGNPLRMLGTHTNITDRKQAEADLKERNDHIQLLYEITRDLLSTNQPLDLVDALFTKLKSLVELDIYFNYLLDEREQKLHLMFYGGISEETAQAIEWLDLGQAVCGTVAQQECQIVQPNLQQSIDPKTELVRSLGLTAYSCQPLISQGKLFGTLGFGSLTRTEFTPAQTQLFQAICARVAIALDRSQLVYSLQQQTEELTRANRLKDEFLAALSHELRTPLNPILGWTKLLQSQKLTDVKTKEALATIERNVKQQIALVDDLLDLSRVVRGQFKLICQPIDLVPILHAAIDTVRFTAIAKSIALEFHLPSQEIQAVRSIDRVMGDEIRLQQIFWNLLSNAIKFTPDGGRIDVWLEKAQNNAQIRIKDTGVGISSEFLPYVFDRFRQADGSTTRRYGGLGLGLALVKHLVELHGGTVEAESSGLGEGAIFTVNLPLLQQASSDFPESNSTQSQNDSLPSFPSGSLTGIRVLIVDDESDNLDLLDFILAQEGAIVTAVTSATEVIAMVRDNPPDILISDIGMPEMSGYELLQQLRALPSQQNNPIGAIALTAFAQQEDKEQAIAAGFQAYLSKPINPIELITAVSNFGNGK
jgi:PAS domain S-box-containing protein